LSISEHARLVEWGTSFLESQLPLLEQLFFEAHLPPPGLEIHAGQMLPGSARAFEVVKEAGRPTFRIAADAAGIKQAVADTLQAYLRQGVPKDDFAASAKEWFGDGFGRRAGRRSRFSMADGPDRSKERKNTWGDLNFYRRLRESPHPAERREWEFWRDYLFREETLARFSPQDWLRALRVLSGLSTVQMGRDLGMQQRVYCNYENRDRSILPLHHCIACLTHHLFQLPTQEHDPTTVEPEVARKFLVKFGHRDQRYRDQLAAAIKARALTEFTDPDPSPYPMNARTVLHALASRKKVRFDNPETGSKATDVLRLEKWQTDPARTPSSDYLFVAPVVSTPSDHVLTARSTLLHRSLAQRSILSLAEDAQSMGDFLGRYQRLVGRTTPEVGQLLGVRGQAVRLYHRRSNLRHHTLERIIASNAYDFSTGEDGSVYPEVAAALHAVNEGRTYRNPYVGVGDAAKALLIPPMEPIAEVGAEGRPPGRRWAARATRLYQSTAAREAWGDYWGELEQRFKNDGRLTIAGKPVRCWLDEWDRLLIHKDDIPRLARDPRWKQMQSSQRPETGQLAP
jgi:hypothetical protein